MRTYEIDGHRVTSEEVCEHRSGDGAATRRDLERFRAGDECPACGCTLSADRYWYVDAAAAARREEV